MYAQLITTLMAVLSFSAGMPVLYLIAAIFYIIYYLVYHCLILRYHSKTANFNHNLPMASLDYIYWALVLHLFFGMFMFTNEKLIPAVRSDAFGSYAESLMSAYAFTDGSSNLSSLTYSMHSIIYLLVLLAFIIVRLVFDFLQRLFSRLWACLTSCCKSDSNVVGQAAEFTSQNYFKELAIASLKKLYERADKDL